MTANHAHSPPECEHHWNSHLQPKNVGLRWIKQCSHCGDFDTDNLREQVAAAEQRGAIKALREFADAHRMPFVMFSGKDYRVTVSDLLRETARNIEQRYRADQEGDRE